MKKVVADQLQTFLKETDSLDLFQLGLRSQHGIETAFVPLQDDLLREIQILLWPLIPSTTVAFMGWLSSLGVGGSILPVVHVLS